MSKPSGPSETPDGTAREDTRDPTSIRAQPALTTSSGTSWLVVGGLFTLIAAGMLVALAGFPPPGLALTGAAVVVLLALGIVLARLLLPAGRRRLGVMAALLLASATIALGVTIVVAWSAWQGV